MSNRGKTFHLKVKKLKSGKTSYFLKHYNPISGKRHKEYLGLYGIQKPKNQFDRKHNQEIKSIADSIFAKRLLEIKNGNHGFKTNEFRHITPLSYFEEIMNKKRESSQTSFHSWRSSLKHLKRFTTNDPRLSEVDTEYLNGFKEFLLKENLTKSNTRLSQNSASTYLNKLIACINEAFNNSLIEHNPVRRIKNIKPDEVQREFLTEEEIQLLFKTSCKAERIKNSFLFGILTGLRFSILSNRSLSSLKGFSIC